MFLYLALVISVANAVIQIDFEANAVAPSTAPTTEGTSGFEVSSRNGVGITAEIFDSTTGPPVPCTGTRCLRTGGNAGIGNEFVFAMGLPAGADANDFVDAAFTFRVGVGSAPGSLGTYAFQLFACQELGPAPVIGSNGDCSSCTIQTAVSTFQTGVMADNQRVFSNTLNVVGGIPAPRCWRLQKTESTGNEAGEFFIDNISLQPVTSAPTPAPIPGGGDPHFKPLNGDNVWFTPVGPKTPAVYNLITHQNLQVNSMWKRSANYEQLISEVAVLSFSPETAKETRTLISVVGQGRNSTLLVKVDGALVAAGVSTDSLKWKGKNKVEVTTDLAVLTYFIAYSKPASYLDFFVSKMDKPALRGAHGILGQTARDNVPYRQPNAVELSAMKRDPLLGCTKCYVEGQVGQYIVTDGIYGKEFQYNLYRK